ncbi:MAG: 1,4-dihydroxy-2-naphthoate polyprenyltransferase [Clostridia bacterium]|nr:1,4-dihydroxy-2-naphthoate polyprenyltransferase [Clostridia bacterium]
MKFSSFLKLVEIQTKLASMVPFLLGTFYAVYHFRRIDFIGFLFLFISILTFDMLTTALNNYFDYKKAIRKYGYNYEIHNAIARDNLKETTVLITMLTLFVIATLFGILLVIKTNIIVLLVGMISFAIGISYSFGPVPISRTPLGEAFSGFFMGFIIVFLAVYIHVYDKNIISILFGNAMLFVQMNYMELLYIFLLSIPPICGIANIMLANNICDMEDDIENRRYTLPIYIGKKTALLIFKSLYYIAYAAIIILSAFRIVPLFYLLSLLTFIIVRKNIKLFEDKQSKEITFALSVKNFLMISGSQVLLLAISSILKL